LNYGLKVEYYKMKKITLIIAFIFFSFTISAQIVISQPSLGFTQACASSSFNTYNVTFTFSPESNLTATNQFIVELSDETGDFTNATTIYTSTQGTITTSPATISFSVPTTIAGEAFKVKIKSTSPVASSTGSVAFSAYYKLQDSPFSINNLISSAAYCSSGSYMLSIDNPGYGTNDSPLQYPSLTFNWFKETSETTSVFVDSGISLEVSEPGTYFVETNYGTCTSDSFSNRVTISEATSNITSSINSSLGNPYCSSQGTTVLSTINGVGFQWFKDGSEISGATNQTYETGEPGTYSVNIDLGDCTTSASINLENNGFSSSIDVPERNFIEQGESLVATVTTDAINPEFRWYLNEVIISGATNNSYEATQLGSYKVIINQTAGCIASSEFIFSISEPFPDVVNIPNLISPNGDGINDTWVIPQEFVNGTEAEVIIISSQGKVEIQTTNYLNDWPQNELDFKDVNPVYYYIITASNGKTNKGSITVVR